MARSFKSIAITLITAVLIAAIGAAIYLGVRFSSKSKLSGIVPLDAEWVYQFQTKEVRDKLQGDPPPYYDSFRTAVQKLPVFKNIRDPKDVGLALFSDLILFETKAGWFLCIGVNSQSSLKKFIASNVPSGTHNGLLDRKNYSFCKASGRNMYFGFSSKEALIYVPSNSAVNVADAEKVLDRIFTPGSPGISQNPGFDALFKNNEVLYFNGDFASHGVSFENGLAIFDYPSKKVEQQGLSPLFLFKKAGIDYNPEEIDKLLKPDNRLRQNDYLNQSFRIAYQHLKPFLQ